MRGSIDPTHIRAPKDSVPGILHDLKMKSASFLRCYIEYGTYVDELDADKARLEEATAQGKEVGQLEAVVKETSSMIPITQKNVKKIHTGFVEFWAQRKQALEKGLANAPPKDRQKWLREMSFQAKNLEKMTLRKHNPLTQEETAAVNTILAELKQLAESGQLPESGGAKTLAPSAASGPAPPKHVEHPPPVVATPAAERAGTSGLVPADQSEPASPNPSAASPSGAASPVAGQSPPDFPRATPPVISPPVESSVAPSDANASDGMGSPPGN